MREKVIWFTIGALSLYAFDRWVKGMPGKSKS
jgi:hypothetical protein